MAQYTYGATSVITDSNVLDITNQRAVTKVISMLDPIGGVEKWVYDVHISSTGELGYTKSTDNGATFGTFVVIDAVISTYISSGGWYDRWTDSADQTGDLIYVAGANTTDNGVRFFTIDTGNSDAIGGDIAALTSTALQGNPIPSVSKGFDGTLYVMCDFATTSGIQMADSANGGSTWNNRGFLLGTAAGDKGAIFPVKTDNDMLLIFVDISGTDTIRYNRWDAVGKAYGTNTTIISDNGINPLMASIVHDPDSGDVYITLRTKAGNRVNKTPTIYNTYLYGDVSGTAVLKSSHDFVSDGGDGTLAFVSIALDITTKSLIMMVLAGGGTANNPIIMFSHDGGVSWSAANRADNAPPDDYRTASSCYHIIDETLGYHGIYYNDDTNDIHLTSYILKNISGVALDNSEVAVSGARISISIIDPNNNIIHYDMGTAISDVTGAWQATILDADNDNVEVQVIGDDSVLNQVDASIRKAVDSF